MLIGVCTSQDSAITRKVTHSACGSPGSLRTARQLVRPDGTISPIPSQVVKLSSSTPISGMTPKAVKNTSAGIAIHPSDRPCRSAPDRAAPAWRTRRWRVVTCPMTSFMLVANCCGVMVSWNSLAMLSSSVSAAVGASAWSQDCAKTLALLDTS